MKDFYFLPNYKPFIFIIYQDRVLIKQLYYEKK